MREGAKILRGLQLASYRLGLWGKADVVEFTPAGDQEPGIEISGSEGRWQLGPIEFKRGRPKAHRADDVQLCAQGICLEEEFGVRVPAGEIFYEAVRRRVKVAFSRDLRQLTERVALEFHDLVDSGRIPVRHRGAKCKRCSLLPICLPPKRGPARSAAAYLEKWLAEELGEV